MDYLVDLETLKHYSQIEGDVNSEKLTVILKRVQDTQIEPILGTPLYKKLLTDVENDSLSGVYADLMPYVLDCIYIACDMKAVVHQNFKIRNKYTGIADDQNGRANTTNENENLINFLNEDFVFYKNRLIGFLIDNKDNYPEYTECNNKEEELKPDKKGNNYSNKISFI